MIALRHIMCVHIVIFLSTIQFGFGFDGEYNTTSHRSIASIQYSTTILDDIVQLTMGTVYECKRVFNDSTGSFPRILDVMQNVVTQLANLFAPLTTTYNLRFGNRRHICSGAILNQKNVLTTANCLAGLDLKYIRIKVGVDDWRGNAHLYKVKVVKPLPNFKENSYDSDLALVQITTAFKFGERVDKVFMPQELNDDDFYDFHINSKQGTVYSYKSYDLSMSGGHLVSAEVSFKPHEDCSADIPESDSSFNFCVQEEDIGFCREDEGALVFVNFKGKDVLHSIALGASFNKDRCLAFNTSVMFIYVGSVHADEFEKWITGKI